VRVIELGSETRGFSRSVRFVLISGRKRDSPSSRSDGKDWVVVLSRCTIEGSQVSGRLRIGSVYMEIV
jgi:hypothetical protein